MSLVPKIDEVREVTNSTSPDFLSITETWLQEHVHSKVAELNGYAFTRRDRQSGIHGGTVSVFTLKKYSVFSSRIFVRLLI